MHCAISAAPCESGSETIPAIAVGFSQELIASIGQDTNV